MFWFRNEEELYEQGRPIEEQYLEKILPVKLQIALEYSRRRTFFSDLDIIFRTMFGLEAPSVTESGVFASRNAVEGCRISLASEPWKLFNPSKR
jgi:hypothetical protein